MDVAHSAHTITIKRSKFEECHYSTMFSFLFLNFLYFISRQDEKDFSYVMTVKFVW